MKDDLKPSDTCVLIASLTKTVSADSLLISSPVLFLSKNAISCLTELQNYVEFIILYSFEYTKLAGALVINHRMVSGEEIVGKIHNDVNLWFTT